MAGSQDRDTRKGPLWKPSKKETRQSFRILSPGSAGPGVLRPTCPQRSGAASTHARLAVGGPLNYPKNNGPMGDMSWFPFGLPLKAHSKRVPFGLSFVLKNGFPMFPFWLPYKTARLSHARNTPFGIVINPLLRASQSRSRVPLE